MATAALIIALAACVGVVLLYLNRIRPVSLKSSLGIIRQADDPWSSLGPSAGPLAVGASTAATIPGNYNRQFIEFRLDPSTTSTTVVYILFGGGTPSQTNFHAALAAGLPPLRTTYTGTFALLSSSGTVHLGITEA